MKKQYILSEKEYKVLVPKEDLKELQDRHNGITKECMRQAKEADDCIQKRRYCVAHPNNVQDNTGKYMRNPDHCMFIGMCNYKNKSYEPAPRELDHMIE